jgi:DNA transformation protein and related proteins
MPARDHPFVAYCLELLAPLGPVRARAMFGGHGIYVDDLFVALIVFDRLYLKVDAVSQPRFEAAGCEPFVYDGKDKPITVSYWTMPPDAMESPAIAGPWAKWALEAALRARSAKSAPKASTASAAPSAPKTRSKRRPKLQRSTSRHSS